MSRVRDVQCGHRLFRIAADVRRMEEPVRASD
jgi:hypothetical protein